MSVTTQTTLSPLSSVQRDIWFEQMLHADLPVHNIGGYIRIDGPLDLQRFIAAIRQLTVEADALRMRVTERRGLPCQYFADSAIDVEVVDYSTAAEPLALALAAMQQRMATPFDLLAGPLVIFTVYKLSEQCHVWSQINHHLAADGWSAALISQRVATIYNDRLAGLPPAPPTLSTYAAFITADLAYQQSPQFGRDVDFWRQQFAVLPEPLLSPRRAMTQTLTPGAVHTLHWPRTRYAHWEQWAQRCSVSTYHALIALLYVYFTRSQSCDGCVIGLPVLNRGSVAFKQTIGMFASMIPVRFEYPPNLSLVELMQAIARTLRRHYRHQRLPLSDINRAAGLLQHGRQRLFDLGFSYEKHDYAVNFGANPPSRTRFLNHGHEQTPLAIFVRDTSESHDVQLDFSYNLAYFDGDDVQRIARRLLHLADDALAHPDRPISELTLLPDDEYDTVRRRWNATATPLPATTVPALFEAQVAKSPNAQALQFEDQTWSYAELDAEANRLAHALLARGIGAEHRVALALQRSLTMIAALLAVFKVGAAYVPLTPDYPAARLAFMLADSDARLLLTTSDVLPGLPASSVPVLCLDERAQLADCPTERPDIAIAPQQLAYVIYTSGSTGQPKGVMIEQLSVVNRLLWMQAEFPLTADDRVLQKTPAGFDVSVWEFFWPLLVGATLVVARPDGHRDNQYLAKLIASCGITTLHFVPPMLQAFLDVPGLTASCQSLRRVFCSGQELPAQLPPRFFAALPDCRLVNLYGPTEATVDVSYYALKPDDRDAIVPIGRPIANTQLYVLDRRGQPAPIGVIGELFIGGVGVARGYLNRAELSAERFVSDPFGDSPDARLYRTGDLARWRGDGQLEFLGRIDQQIKLRGFRIEPGEIEATLAEHPVVAEALVVMHGADAHQRLTAYFVAAELALPDAPELGAFLSARLPDYMVPSAFIAVERWPLTPNGKIDRAALPTPEYPTAISDASTQPQDELETAIAGLWADVLGVAAVSRSANFFALGGHSLLATQLATRLQAALSVSAPVRLVFESPTVAELAAQLRPAWAAGASVDTTPLPRADRNQPLPLSYAQQRLWFLDQLEGPSATYNMPGAWQLEGKLNVSALATALTQLATRHEPLRTRLPAANGVAVQVIDPPDAVPLPVVELRDSADVEAETLRRVQAEALTPFDLAKDWPLRAQLLRCDDQAWTLLVTVHHIAADGWSVPILLQELNALYRAEATGVAAALPELTVQYADFAAWQRRLWSDGQLNRELDFWRRALAGAPACLDLPCDRPRPSRQSHRGDAVPLAIDAELTDALRELGGRSGATLFMTLLAAWMVLLARHSGNDDLVVGAPVAHRTRAELEPLIGFFVNTLALRADLSGNPPFTTVLAQLRARCLAAYAHQSAPFDRLVDALQVPRHLAHAPVFQVMFAWQNQGTAQAQWSLPDVMVQPLTCPNPIAKFDLTLSLAESECGLTGSLEFATDLFDRDTIERWAGHFTNLLRSIVASPSSAIGALPLLSDDEYDTVSRRWNAATLPCLTSSLPTLFETEVDRAPTAPAIQFENQIWSYAELDATANRWAQALLAQGVAAEDRVAVALNRSPELIAALLAVLKAGAAYVPLAPDYPPARLAFMLADSGAKLLLTTSELLQNFATSTVPTLCLDRDAACYAALPANRPQLAIAPSQLAYVIYTSGSTGQPKGVMIEHGALAQHCAVIPRYFELTPQDRVLQFASINFDASVEQIFCTLAAGATLVLAARGDDAPADVQRCIATQRVSVAHLTPALAEQWLQLYPNGLSDSALRLLQVGGDVFPKSLVTLWQSRLPADGRPIRLLNGYGPTEATVTSTFHELPAAPPGASVPIGRPLPGRTALVLDDYRQVAPIGVAGELYLGGAGVARGYLNRAELSSTHFIADPFSDHAHARLYRTGDRARWRADGQLEFLGRIDQQLKLRGFRIEPGEIEAALAEHPAVIEALVVAKGDNGDKRLLAYWIAARDAATPDAAELREFLAARLPDYMLPSAYVAVERWPLTSNGKIDRAALPAPEAMQNPAHYRAPRTAVERRLAGIWETLLDKRPIGVDDNFFELGGHSLLAVRLVADIRQAFGVAVPVSRLFEFPTLAALAELLRSPNAAVAASCLVAMRAGGTRPPLYFLPGAGGMVNYLYPLVRHIDADMPFYALQAQGLDGAETPHANLDDMAAHYVERMRAAHNGPYLLAGHSFGARVALRIAQQLTRQGQTVGRLIVVDATAPGLSHRDPDIALAGSALLKDINALFGQAFGAELMFSDDELERFSAGQLQARFAQRLEASGLLPDGQGADWLRRLLTIYQHQLRMHVDDCAADTAGPTWPVCLIKAQDSSAPCAADDDWGWSRYAAGPVRIIHAPGNHVTMMTLPHCKALAEILNALPPA